MDTKNRFLLPLLLTGLTYAPGQLAAQTFTTLYNFTARSVAASYTNADGGAPQGLILSGDTLYGTCISGGSSDKGTVFAVKTDGTGFTTLYSFSSSTPPPAPLINADGIEPNRQLVLSSNTLYGTCQAGGSSGSGTVFAVKTDGTGFSAIYSFSAVPDYALGGPNSDGAWPMSGLMLSGGPLYGTARSGGNSGNGTVFMLNTDGSGFTAAYSFTDPFVSPSNVTNADGAQPFGGVILSGNVLYGTCEAGGDSAVGTIFKVNTDGTGFTTLHSFAWTDGAHPLAGLVLSNSTLYGTTQYGGSSGSGTVFKLNTDGTGFKTLHTFSAPNSGTFVNTDGLSPRRELLLSGNTLYGTCPQGGSSGSGTVFSLKTDGSDFEVVHSFSNTDGASPTGLVLSGNTLYGAAGNGGLFGSGTIFSISLPPTPPQLTLALSGGSVVLTWPTSATGFSLQSITNLVSLGAWTFISATPVVVNGQNTVTNPISGTQQFYRLVLSTQ